jgi:hypothetical protein
VHRHLRAPPHITHKALLAMKPQKAIIRRRGRCEPTNQAEITVTTMAGHCTKSMYSKLSLLIACSYLRSGVSTHLRVECG